VEHNPAGSRARFNSSKVKGTPQPPANAAAAEAEATEPSLPVGASIADKMKALWAMYGYVFIGTHLGVYFTTLAVLYGGVANGMLGSTKQERDENLEKVVSKLEPYIPTSAINTIRKSPALGEQCGK